MGTSSVSLTADTFPSRGRLWGARRADTKGDPIRAGALMGRGTTDALLSFGACAKAKAARRAVTKGGGASGD